MEKKYLIVPSFLNKNDILHNPFSTKISLEDNKELAYTFCNDVFFLKTVFANRIYGNSDRLPQNYGVIFDGKKFKSCPLFDNGETIFYRDSKYFPKLKNGSNDMNEVIAYTMQNEEVMHWITHAVKKANLQNIAERLKKEKNFIISNDTYKAFESFFRDSEIIVNEELKAKGKAPCIKFI